MMIVSLLIYSSTLHLKLSSTQISRLCSVERRAKHIMRQNYRSKPIENSMKKQACFLVKECLTNNVCQNLDSYFTLNLHEKNAQNKGILLKLPTIRLGFQRKSFYFQGAFLFNSLPQSTRYFEDYDDFKCAPNSYFN